MNARDFREKALKVKQQAAKNICLPRTCAAVNLSLGSEFNMLLTRSFAEGEIEGHGSLVKSTWPLRMALNIPCSDSGKPNHFFSSKHHRCRKKNED